MTTVQFDLRFPACSGSPHFEENDYSIHLRGRLSQEELSQSLHELNDITHRYYPRRIWIWVVIFVMIFPWLLYTWAIVAMDGFSWGLFIGVMIAQYIPLIAWFVYYYRRLRIMREHVERHIGFLNQKYYSRSINFRIRSHLHGAEHRHYGGGRRWFFILEIEIAQDPSHVGYQHQNPVAPPPYAPPPAYSTLPPPSYSHLQGTYVQQQNYTPYP